MDVVFDLRKPLLVLALAAGAGALGACQEDLAGGAACPALCPEQSLEVRDTVIFPVAVDTTLRGYPPLGAEPQLLLAQRGDTLATAIVARFDTLYSSITRGTDPASQKIVGIDTANVTINVLDTTATKARVTVDVYDVDTNAGDFDTAAVRALFRPDRLLSSRSFAPDSVKGALQIPVPASFLLPRVVASGRVRLGIAVRSDSAVQLHAASTESSNAPGLT